MPDLDAILRAPLRIHKNRSLTYAVDPELARFLHEAAPAATTLETGSGLSTLVLLNGGVRHHIAVQPNASEFDAIRDHAGDLGVATDALQAVVACSQDYLPGATLPPLDLLLIDGHHGFPFPFIDWYYAGRAVKLGGTVIVDDVHIATGTFLAEFLSADPAWAEIARDRVACRYAIYRRTAEDAFSRNWDGQPYLAAAYPTTSVKLRRRAPKGAIEAAAGRLPRRVQEALRKRFRWPRDRWME